MARSRPAKLRQRLWQLLQSWRMRGRRQRMRRLASIFQLTPATRILDVGGTPDMWELLEGPANVVAANVGHDVTLCRQAGMTVVAADGCQLPFRDGAFDIVFSNSVIEHLGSWERQRRFAAEVARTGKGYFVETPNRWFPVEQHLMTPLLHWLPGSWQRWLAPRFNFWALLESPSPDRHAHYVTHYLRDVHLLSARELQALFPDAQIYRERWLGLTKALIAVRKPASASLPNDARACGRAPRTTHSQVSNTPAPGASQSISRPKGSWRPE